MIKKELDPFATRTVTTEDELGNVVEEEISILIPQCCREGWIDCPHVVNREPRATKKNIGL